MPERAPNPPIDSEVKKFTKERAAPERSALAQEIKSKRKEYFDRQRSIKETIAHLIEQAQQRAIDAREAALEVEDIQYRLSEKKHSIISKIFKTAKVKRLEADLGRRVANQKNFEREYQEINLTIQNLEENRQDQHELEEVRSSLRTFYEQKSVEWEDYEEEQKIRDVSTVIERYDVMMVHGIHASLVPGDNSLLHKDTTWREKLDILMALNPSVSTSTIKAGDGAVNMWARAGVLINGGSISVAESHDAATVANKINSRARIGSGKDEESLELRIATAIRERKPNHYNELVVERPLYAGLYVSLDKVADNLRRLDMPPQEEILKASEELGLPVYVLQEGLVFQANWDEGTKQYEPGDQVNPAIIREQHHQMSEPAQHELTESIFRKSPFRIHNPEVGYFDSRSSGMGIYMDLEFAKNPGGAPGENMETIDGIAARKIGEFPRFAGKTEYFERDGRLVCRTLSRTHEWPLFNPKSIGEYQNGYLNLGGRILNFERPIISHEDYLASMEAQIKKLTTARGNLDQDKDYYVRYYNELLNTLAFNLRGYAEQAQQMGQPSIAQRASEIAQKIVSDQEYDDYKQRRIDEQGKFRVYRKDLE